METTSQKIDRFCDHFLQHSEVAENELSKLGEENLYARMILCTMLDTLSQVAYPSTNGVGKRYEQLIVNASRWSDAKRVSALHVWRAVSSEGGAFAGVVSWADTLLKSKLSVPNPDSLIMHLSEGVVRIDIDPSLSEVKAHWPSDSGKSQKTSQGLTPECLTHARLLYQYRNKLVHEMRVLGRGWEIEELENPYYQIMADVDGRFQLVGKRWELIYPLGFIAKVCRTCVEWLRNKLHASGRKPL